mmetsp:Transcript_59556/g.186689  ORF Transcript_59556/g.186689 Transcript_59556/m.186689 type:complete len:219 (+) Transcript_59556:170-826(+)
MPLGRERELTDVASPPSVLAVASQLVRPERAPRSRPAPGPRARRSPPRTPCCRRCWPAPAPPPPEGAKRRPSLSHRFCDLKGRRPAGCLCVLIRKRANVRSPLGPPSPTASLMQWLPPHSHMGLPFFDLAEGYGGGTSELRLAASCTRVSSPGLPQPVIATKFLPTVWRYTQASFMASLDESLRRLAVSRTCCVSSACVHRVPGRGQHCGPVPSADCA